MVAFDPVIPDYSGDVLGGVLPAAAGALGVKLEGAPAWGLPGSERVCVVLVDGLGYQLLAESVKSAPFLLSHLNDGRVLRAGFPTTTAASMGSFGTGTCPGKHGMVGYEVLDPDRDVLLNGLKWDDEVDPLDWQVYPTVFEKLDDVGVESVRIGPARFNGSGLTDATLRGGRFMAAAKLHHCVAAAVKALEGPGKRLAYLYWGAVDYSGHTHGWQSRQWRSALGVLDRGLQRLAARLPAGTLLLVTADHGMIDLPHRDRVDLADTPEMLSGVRHIGGETRALQLYCEPDRVEQVAQRFLDRFGDRAWVRTRAQAIEQGWFGAVDERVRPRIGDVLVAAAGSFGLVDSRVAQPQVLKLVGQHGSLTEAEQLIPLLVLQT